MAPIPTLPATAMGQVAFRAVLWATNQMWVTLHLKMPGGSARSVPDTN